MKQVYSAGPFAGAAALRGASHGVGADQAQATLAVTGYATPPGRNGSETPLPVRLALLNTASGGVNERAGAGWSA